MTSNLKAIKKDFDKVITYSQKIETPKTDELFDKWIEAKRDIIEAFNGKLIYEFPQKITFELEEAEKHERILHFSNYLASNGNIELAKFIEIQENGFFKNKTISNYTMKNGDIIQKGTKLVKAFKYFINNDKTLNELQNKASQIIQEDKIEGKLCLSVHPLDYLSISENTYNWRSCHALDGEYCAGNLSYMLDRATIVCYLKGDKKEKLPHFPEDVLWNSKKWRVLLYLSKDWKMIFAGKPYPFPAKNGMNLILHKVLPKTKIMPKCDSSYGKYFWTNWSAAKCNSLKISEDFELDFLNSYIPIDRGLKALSDLVVDAPGSRHYNDVLRSSTYDPVYTFQMYNSHFFGAEPCTSEYNTKFEIGGSTPCLCCGKNETLDGENVMLCEKCLDNYDEKYHNVYCDICGSRIPEEESTTTADGEIVCEECLRYWYVRCDECEEYVRKSDIIEVKKYDCIYCTECYENLKEEGEI